MGSVGQHRAMPWEPGLARVFSHESGLQWFEKLLGVMGRYAGALAHPPQMASDHPEEKQIVLETSPGCHHHHGPQGLR